MVMIIGLDVGKMLESDDGFEEIECMNGALFW